MNFNETVDNLYDKIISEFFEAEEQGWEYPGKNAGVIAKTIGILLFKFPMVSAVALGNAIIKMLSLAGVDVEEEEKKEIKDGLKEAKTASTEEAIFEELNFDKLETLFLKLIKVFKPKEVKLNHQQKELLMSLARKWKIKV